MAYLTQNRRSRAGGNPSHRRPKAAPWMPACAGMTGTSRPHIATYRRSLKSGNPSRHRTTTAPWIPACAGMTDHSGASRYSHGRGSLSGPHFMHIKRTQTPSFPCRQEPISPQIHNGIMDACLRKHDGIIDATYRHSREGGNLAPHHVPFKVRLASLINVSTSTSSPPIALPLSTAPSAPHAQRKSLIRLSR